MRRHKVVHIITRLIGAGAEANTLITVEALRKRGYDTFLICGPPLGCEGSRLEEAKERDTPLVLIPELVRELNPHKDIVALLKLWRLLLQEHPLLVHTHCSKAGILGRWAARLACPPCSFPRPCPHHCNAEPDTVPVSVLSLVVEIVCDD